MRKSTLLLLMALTLIACKKEEDVEVEDAAVVTVTFSDGSVSVDIPDEYADYVTYSTSGAHLTLVQSESVDSTTCGEIEYAIYGSTSNGSLTLEGSYKATIGLYGATITNPSGAALTINDGKRIKLSAKEDTESTLVDGTGSQKACIECKGHLKLRGKGILNVYANNLHGIWSKEYIEVKNISLNIYSAQKDAINCSQYFYMKSGTIYLAGFLDDGVQVSKKENDDSEENTGNFTLEDGFMTINMNVSNDGKAVKVEGTATGTDQITIISE